MAETPKDQQPAPEAETTPAHPGGRLAGMTSAAIKGAKAAGGLLQKAGLYLFIVLLPLAITGYPAYLIVHELAQSADATTVEATLTDIDINRVPDGETDFFLIKSKGHTNVTLSFQGKDGRKYRTVIEKPWTAPGLRKQMDTQYRDQETFTLYLTKDGKAQIDEQVAGTRMTLLSLLMALVLLASAMAIFLRHRLADRMPSLVSHESAANSRSIIYGQLTSLLAAFAFTVLMYYAPEPVVVSNTIFLGIYWGVAVLVGISLRLLVFQNPSPPPPEPEEEPRVRRPR